MHYLSYFLSHSPVISNVDSPSQLHVASFSPPMMMPHMQYSFPRFLSVNHGWYHLFSHSFPIFASMKVYLLYMWIYIPTNYKLMFYLHNNFFSSFNIRYSSYLRFLETLLGRIFSSTSYFFISMSFLRNCLYFFEHVKQFLFILLLIFS